jgi:16S rRNA (uracil1498-N3)-methyltransferase
MSRFFIPAAQITNRQATVYGPEFHHLRHVLRLQIGDSVTLRDDLDQEHRGTITHLAASEAIISISTTIKAPASHFSLTLAQGLLKGPKMDLVVEKTT